MGQNDDGDHRRRLLQQPHIGDGIGGVHAHDSGAVTGVGLHAATPEQMDHHDLHRQHDDNDGSQVNDEIVKRDSRERTDQDVGRIADQGRGAADVRGEDLCEEEGIGRDFEFATDGERYRRDQQNGRHIVQQSREDGGDYAEHDQNARRIGLHPLRR